MRTFTADTWLTASPDHVLDLLTVPDAITRWSPFPFELVEIDGGRLVSGGRAIVRGALGGRGVQFDVEVEEAEPDCLALVARGPIEMDVEYLILACDCGTEIRASVSVAGAGLLGRVLARAAEVLLAAGALEQALARIARQLAPARV